MAKVESAAIPEIEEFDPPSDWAGDEASETLIVMLPGFMTEQLRVQIISNSILKISGERVIDNNKRRRFSQEHPLPQYCDPNRISAKFEGGMLYIKLPKIITQASPPEPQQKPSAMIKSPPPSPPSKADQQKSNQEVIPPKTNEISQKPPQKEKEEAREPKKKRKLVDENGKKLDQEKEEKGLDEKEKEKIGVSGIVKDEAKVETKLPSQVLQASPSAVYRDYKETFVGLMERLKMQKKVVNLVLAILFFLVLGLYVKDAIKSSSGGSKIQEL